MVKMMKVLISGWTKETNNCKARILELSFFASKWC